MLNNPNFEGGDLINTQVCYQIMFTFKLNMITDSTFYVIYPRIIQCTLSNTQKKERQNLLTRNIK